MFTNRIVESITAMRAQIEKRISDGIATRKQVAEAAGKMDMDYTEWSLFQDTKSLAHASGLLTAEEAQTVYAVLGGSPEEFNSNDAGTKAVMTKLFAQLLQWKAAKRGNLVSGK